MPFHDCIDEWCSELGTDVKMLILKVSSPSTSALGSLSSCVARRTKSQFSFADHVPCDRNIIDSYDQRLVRRLIKLSAFSLADFWREIDMKSV